MTETSEVAPMKYADRVVVGDTANLTPVGVVNVRTQPHFEWIPSNWWFISCSGDWEGDGTRGEKKWERAFSDRRVVLCAEPTEAMERLEHLLKEYADVFSLSEKNLGRINLREHGTYTADSHQIKQPLRKQPLAYGYIIESSSDKSLRLESWSQPQLSELLMWC